MKKIAIWGSVVIAIILVILFLVNRSQKKKVKEMLEKGKTTDPTPHTNPGGLNPYDTVFAAQTPTGLYHMDLTPVTTTFNKGQKIGTVASDQPKKEAGLIKVYLKENVPVYVYVNNLSKTA